jgi:glycerol kinase
VADVIAAMRESVEIEALRVDGGLTRSPTLLALQADAAGVAVQRGSIDATAAGAAALAAVGGGVWDSTAEIGARIPAGEPVTPTRDREWRERAHEEWREFVRAAAAL